MNIKQALTRKYGPLAAWTWLLLFGAGVWYYRRRFSAVSSTGTGSVTPGPGPEPGTGEQVLQPGESVYDPTAGTLTTAPGGGSGDSGSNADMTGFIDAINALATAIATGMPPQQVNVTGGDPSPGGSKKKPPKLRGRGAIRAPSGHSKPKAPKGYNVKGLGHGFWEFLPKARSKSKGQDNSKTKSGGRKRSNSTTRKNSGGRTSSRKKKPEIQSSSWASHTSNASTQSNRARQRPRTPAVTRVIRQRAVATHPSPSATARRPSATTSPRPSAPPPRTQRSQRTRGRP